MWQMIAVWFVLTVLGELLTPKPKPPKNNSQLEFPDNRQDRKIPLFAGTVQLRGPMLAWWGDIRKKPIEKKVKSGLFSSTKTVVGYKYYGAMQLVLGHGKIDAVKALHFARKPAWTGSVASGAITLNLPELFGDKEAEGGIGGTLYVHNGDSAQAVDGYLAAKLGAVPAHGGVAYCVWSNTERTGGGYLGNSNSPPEIWITVQRLPRLLASGKHDIGGHANPAEFLYEMHVSQAWGAGMGTDQLDTASFLAAANTLHAEGMGIAPLYADDTDVETICLDVLEHIDGALYGDIFTGKIVLVLARSDYTVGSLPVFDESNSILTDYSHGAWDETVNEVHVSFLDASTGEQNTVVAQDLANQQIQQAVVARTIDYPACPTPAQAQKLAWRDLRALSLPLTKCTVRADRSAWVLRPGNVIRLNNALLGITDMVMRVSRVNYGTLVSGQIELECIQDVFSLSATIYGALPATGWADPTSPPAPALHALLSEAPYHLVRADPDASGPEVGKLLTWAAAPSGDAYQYQIHTRQGADSYVQRGAAPFGATATLAANLAPGATSLTITGLQDGDLLEDTDATGQAQGANLIRIDGEWISWRTRTDNGGGVWTLNTLYRGVLDTVPALHAAATRVRFLSDAMGTTEDEYALTATVDAKYLPQTGQGTLLLASASNLPITLTQRVQRPYPPADIKINGASYPAAILGAYALTWKHRDRTQQPSIIGQPDASIGPETGATYTLRLYGETDTLLRTETGLTGAGYTWSDEEADSGLTVPGGSGGDAYSPAMLGYSPTALYMMEELSGTQMTDTSGNANHGAYVGGALPDSPALVTEGLRSLNATSSLYATAPGAVAAALSGFSVVLWLQWTHSSNLVICERNGNNGYSIQSGSSGAYGAGKIGCASWNGAPFAYLVSSIAINDGLPHSVEFVFGATAATSYILIDGFDRTTRPGGNASPSYGASTVWHIGSRAGSFGFGGRLDGIAFVPSLLTLSDAAAINAAGRATAVRLNGRIRCELESVRAGLTSHQRHNITVDRAGWGYQWGNCWGGLP